MTTIATNKGFENDGGARLHLAASRRGDARTSADVISLEAKRYESMRREYAVSRSLGYTPDEASRIATELGAFIGGVRCLIS